MQINDQKMDYAMQARLVQVNTKQAVPYSSALLREILVAPCSLCSPGVKEGNSRQWLLSSLNYKRKFPGFPLPPFVCLCWALIYLD